jgi:hypothetical protein
MEELQTEPIQTTEAASEQTTTEEAKPSKRALKLQKKFNKQLATMMLKIKREQSAFQSKIADLKTKISSDDFTRILSTSTIVIPQKTDDEGNILQKEQINIDWKQVYQKGLDAIAMNREVRTLNGLRKRSSGRGSSRAMHADRISHIMFVSSKTEELRQQAVAAAATTPAV